MDGKRIKARVFQERTNSPAPALLSVSNPTKSIVEPLMMTPTFEPPSIYVIEVADEDHMPTVEPQRLPEVYETQRLKRYLIAEQELAESFQRCQEENTSYELQIEALRKATSVLNSHVADAGERVVKLRKLLVDRATEPSLYQSLQRERWMEERRQIATEHLSKVLQHHLSTLSSQPEILPQINPSNPASNLKSDTNLIRFFESSSRQRVLTRNRVRRRVPVAPRPQSDKVVEMPRLHDHKQVIPLLLNVPKYQPPFLQEKARLLAQALPVVASPVSPPISVISPTSTSSNPLHFDPIFEVPESKSFIQSSTPSVDATSNGTAIIWRDAPRSTEEILAELVVEMPDYVVDLLAGLDSTSSASTSIQPLHNFQSPRITSSKTTFMPDTPRNPKTSPLPLHKSPSRKRISALFSLPEGLSSRRGISMDAPQQKRLNTHPAQTTHQETTRPFSVSFSGLPSSDSGGSHEPEEDDKVLSRLRRRMSALRRH